MYYLVVICLNSAMVAFILEGVEKICIPDNYPFIPVFHLKEPLGTLCHMASTLC